MSLPQNEFWQCPSYTWSTISLGIIVSIIVFFANAMGGKELAIKVAGFGGFLMTLMALRTLYLWYSPDPRCEAKGFPGQHNINPLHGVFK